MLLEGLGPSKVGDDSTAGGGAMPIELYKIVRGYIGLYIGGCQNYGPFLDPYYNTAPNI